MRNIPIARAFPLFELGVVLALLSRAGDVSALDKQGSGAHGGSVEGPDSGFGVSGAVLMGVSLWNPTYAARPDNSGTTLMRYAAHADIDLIGRRLSIPVDINTFSDADAQSGGRVFVPSEFDVITGLTTTWRLGPGALEIGTRLEHDRPLDDGGYVHPVPAGATTPEPDRTQTYVDARARYLFSLADAAPRLRPALGDGDISGWLTLGWFAINPSENGTYFAHPDNTGRSLFRYAAHSEISFWHDHLAFALDATFFTDSRSTNVIRPSELDLTPEFIATWSPWELHLAYERDMPIDRGGLVQQFVYALVAYEFDWSAKIENDPAKTEQQAKVHYRDVRPSARWGPSARSLR